MNEKLTREDLLRAYRYLQNMGVPGPYRLTIGGKEYKVPSIPMSTRNGEVLRWMPRYEVKR